MTTDQVLNLLAICAWPTVALIAGVAFVHGIRLLVEAADARDRTAVECSKMLSGTIKATFSARYLLKSRDQELAETCERALLTILQANGGFPGSRGDDTTRQLVREVRKMFDEVNRPTPEPPMRREQGQEHGAENPVAITARDLDFVFDIGDMGDLEDVEDPEEIYGS